MVENRHGVRCPAFALVEIRSKSGIQLTGLIYNVSRDGMFVLTDTRLAIKGYVNIRLPQITKNNEPIQISGLVIHRNEVGFGLMFGRLDKEAHMVIEKLTSRSVKQRIKSFFPKVHASY